MPSCFRRVYIHDQDYVGALGTLQWGDGDSSPRVIGINLIDNPNPAPPFGRNFGVRLFMNPGTSGGPSTTQPQSGGGVCF